MVPVGDQRLPRGQVSRHGRVLGRVGHGPERVPQAITGTGAQQRRPGGGHLVSEAGRGAACGSVVEQEDRLQVGLGRLHELPPARYRPGHDILVRQHDPGGGRGEPQRADQPALDDAPVARPAGRPGGLAGGVLAGGVLAIQLLLQPLLVDVQGWLGVGLEDALVLPFPQQPGGLAVLAAGVPRILARQDEPDHVVRVSGEQLVRRVARDHVVRW
jgi:hypothetical protein